MNALMLILNTVQCYSEHMSVLYTRIWSGHTSINHVALQRQAGRSIDFLFALFMEDISKKKKKKGGPVYHYAAEIHLRVYCSQAWFVTDALIYIRSQIRPHLLSTSTRKRGTNT